MVDRTPEQLAVPRMASQYSQMLPHLGWEAIGINLRGFLTFPDNQDGASQYITSNIFGNPSWQGIGKSPVRASVNLVFDLEKSPLYFSVSEALMRKEEDETSISAVMFSGSFSYTIETENSSEQISYIQNVISNWQADLTTFNEVVNDYFIADTRVKEYAMAGSY